MKKDDTVYRHIAQCNLSKYDIVKALRDGKEEFDWKSSYVVNSPYVGDLVLIKTLYDSRSYSHRESSARISEGIYAIAMVTEAIDYRRSHDYKYHSDPDSLNRLKYRFKMKIISNLVETPLLCKTIKLNEHLNSVRGLTESVNGSMTRISKHSFDEVCDLAHSEIKEPISWFQKIQDKINMFLIKYPMIYDSIIRL